VVLFVGEAPGKYEDMKGLPFVGPSGRLLDKEIITAGLGLVAIGMTNVVKCRPIDHEGNNRPPSEEEIASCLPFIRQQIDLLKPRVVVAVGKVAKEALRAYSPIYVLHPSAALRKPDLLDILQRHLKQVKEAVDRLSR
jgi:DNA polymerase